MGLAAVLFPVPCLGCGARGASLCPSCTGQLEPASTVRVPEGLDSCAALTSYDGVARQVISGLKYRNDRTSLRSLATAAAPLVSPSIHGPSIDVVCWVPTVPSHRRRRGFDHGQLLARAVGRALRVPVRGLLARPEGPGQTGRSRQARADPTPFVARRPRRPPRVVVLVDDVVTTGCSLSAAASELRAVGVEQVHGLALGHTPGPT